MNPLKKIIADTATADLVSCDLFLSGFELEFQSCNGKRFTGERQMEPDFDSALTHLRTLSPEAVSIKALLEMSPSADIPAKEVKYGMSVLNASKGGTVKSMRERLGRIELSSEEIIEAIRVSTLVLDSLLSAYVAKVSGELAESEIGQLVDMSQFQREARRTAIYKLNPSQYGMVSIKRDGTVQGGEIVLERPQTPALALEVAKELFTQNKWSIDEGCSFHIHLSVPGITHSYSQGLQWDLMTYILANYGRVPDAVKARWAKNMEYFRPQLSTEKYSFVHFHAGYKTWEFRCFGNVANYEDASACYQLALEAMQHAYRVQLGMAESLTTSPFYSSSTNSLQKTIARQLEKKEFSMELLESAIKNGEAA